MYLGISLDLLRALWGQFSFRQFLVPAYTSSQGLQAPSSVVSANYRVLIYCTCHFQSSFLFFILASSVCKSLQYLTQALTQGGEGCHLFRLVCSGAVGREEHCKQICVCGKSAHSLGHTGFAPAHTCVLSRSTLLRLQVALQGNCLKWALGFVHFPGLSRLGSGSQVLHKSTDLLGPVVCALPRSKQLRRPDVC